jgi:hypothetical protein
MTFLMDTPGQLSPRALPPVVTSAAEIDHTSVIRVRLPVDQVAPIFASGVGWADLPDRRPAQGSPGIVLALAILG